MLPRLLGEQKEDLPYRNFQFLSISNNPPYNKLKASELGITTLPLGTLDQAEIEMTMGYANTVNHKVKNVSDWLKESQKHSAESTASSLFKAELDRELERSLTIC
jgi:hypothetical protein